MERRSLTGGMHAIGGADPNLVRQFVTQERAPTAPLAQTTAYAEGKVPDQRSRTTAAPFAPIGLIPVTIRLRPDLAAALRRASLERQLAGEPCSTQQAIVEQALDPWLRSQGYLG